MEHGWSSHNKQKKQKKHPRRSAYKVDLYHDEARRMGNAVGKHEATKENDMISDKEVDRSEDYALLYKAKKADLWRHSRNGRV